VTILPTGDKPRGLDVAIAALAAVGVVVSSISFYHHLSKSKTLFCDLGQTFNCDLVNRSSYSTVLGVPVALIGIVGYLALLALATVYREKAETPLLLALASLGGLGFALRLAYIEAFVLNAWCLLCLGSLTLILVIAVLSGIVAGKSLQRS
jgi:vitamin-K-epoxide reductase (warfarin-sensitive)